MFSRANLGNLKSKKGGMWMSLCYTVGYKWVAVITIMDGDMVLNFNSSRYKTILSEDGPSAYNYIT